MTNFEDIAKKLRSIKSRSKSGLLCQAADALEEMGRELKDEMHRHDRVQDFEVAEAEQLRQMTIERNMLARKLAELEQGNTNTKKVPVLLQSLIHPEKRVELIQEEFDAIAGKLNALLNEHGGYDLPFVVLALEMALPQLRADLGEAGLAIVETLKKESQCIAIKAVVPCKEE